MGEVLQRHSLTSWSNINLYGLVETFGTIEAIAGIDSDNPRKYKVYRDRHGRYYFNFRGTRVDIESSVGRPVYAARGS